MPRRYTQGEHSYPVLRMTSLRHGVGGPAGSELQPAITGVECEYCGGTMVSGRVAGGHRSCLNRKCRRKHSDQLRREAVA